ncbi:MAG: hypothetical protein CFH36_00928 [Alphaproteobacteria bacterium MarineAlpha9_Bin6]|nr:MAG: hypothetical protein CFH36_00928 [Alphaproteobacteria bacterium MarineAlpha9_Bin6]
MARRRIILTGPDQFYSMADAFPYAVNPIPSPFDGAIMCGAAAPLVTS